MLLSRYNNKARKHDQEDLHTRLIYFQRLDPHHNFNPAFVQTRFTLFQIKYKGIKGLPLTILESLYLRAFQDQKESMKEQTELFEHREAYIKHWKSVEEDHHLIRSSEKKRFNGFLICMVKDANGTLNEKRDGSTTSAKQTIEELENNIDVLMQLLGHHSALALAAPSPPSSPEIAIQ